MTSLLFGIITSALLSITSLLVVIFRVSPLTAPAYALPAFLISILLSVSSLGALFFLALWRILPVHSWDLATIITTSVRQGVMLGLATIIVMLFHMLGLLTWWIAVLVSAVFALIELAVNS